jgi:hypothetical protein
VSAKGRTDLALIFASEPYKEWAAKKVNQPEANKVAKAFAGQPHTKPSSKYAQGLVGLCEENPPIPPPPLTIPPPFDGRGMTLLEPTGGVEDMGAVQEAGFTYVLLNLAFTRGGSWDTVRTRCATRGIKVVPWRTIRSFADVAQVENTADLWGSEARCHELENVQLVSPQALKGYVDEHWPEHPRAVMTQPWAQNGAGWQYLSDWVGMPEAYMNASSSFVPSVLVQHLHDEGMPLAVPLFGWGVWSDAPIYVSPAKYLELWPPPGPYAVYFGDSREPQYGEWKR